MNENLTKTREFLMSYHLSDVELNVGWILFVCYSRPKYVHLQAAYQQTLVSGNPAVFPPDLV